MKKREILNLTLSAMFISIGLVLPFLFGHIKVIGKALLPMHIPVILCGFVCGAPYGAVIGAVLPVLRSVLFGAPVMYPSAVAMTAELAVYGLLSGLMFSLFKKKNLLFIYISLIIALFSGRIVWGLMQMLLLGLTGSTFTLKMFIAGAFTDSFAGIILQFLIIPPLVILLRKVLFEKEIK